MRLTQRKPYSKECLFLRLDLHLGVFVVGYVDDPVHVVERGPVVVVMDGGRTHRPGVLNFHSIVALKGQ
jgi:hypothetical protein